MTQNTFCAGGTASVFAQQYVAENMSPAERDAYENHFVACAVCQNELRIATAIRDDLRAPSQFASGTASRRIPASRFLAGAGALLAAGIAAVAIIRVGPSSDFTSLGGVASPPGYLGEAVRGSPSQGDSLFDSAMRAYSSRRYAEAAAALTAALAAGQDSVPTEFFLGASLLMWDDATGAADRFSHVVAKGESPYLDEARFYEAKALLRLGRGRDALDVLNRRVAANGNFAALMKALSDSVARALAH